MIRYFMIVTVTLLGAAFTGARRAVLGTCCISELAAVQMCCLSIELPDPDVAGPQPELHQGQQFLHLSDHSHTVEPLWHIWAANKIC
jgi:hypothetical protein